MNVISTPVAAVRYGTFNGELHDREGHETRPGSDGERARHDERHEEQSDRQQERHRSEHRRTAGEGEDASSSPKPGEDRERVAHHRSTAADVGQAPNARIGQRSTDERCCDPFCAVADEHRNRGPAAERLPSIPEPRIPVTDVAQIHLGPSGGHQIGDRDRPDQIADHDRDCQVDAHQ